MAWSSFENISNNKISKVNAFAASIDSSAYHWHGEYELLGVLKGEVQVQVAADITILHENNLMLINRNTIHAIHRIEGKDNMCMIVQLSPDLFRLDDKDTSEPEFYLNSTTDEKPECGYYRFYLRMASILYESLSDDKYSPFRVRAGVCELIADLYSYAVFDINYRGENTPDNQELTVSIISFLKEHLEDEQILDLACHEFGISRKTMDRNLQLTIGISGKKAVNDLRLDKAKYLLKNTTKTMNFILDSCGYGSEKTFYRIFHQETGSTPNDFREKGRIDNEGGTIKGYINFETEEVKSILGRILEERINRISFQKEDYE